MVVTPAPAAMVAMALMELQAHPAVEPEEMEEIQAAQVWVVAGPRPALMVWPPPAVAMGATVEMVSALQRPAVMGVTAVTAVPSVTPEMVALAGMAPPGLMVPLVRQRVIQARTARSVVLAEMGVLAATAARSRATVAPVATRASAARAALAAMGAVARMPVSLLPGSSGTPRRPLQTTVGTRSSGAG
jgi:hypothetical protein